MNQEIFNNTHILYDKESKTQEEAFQSIASFAHEKGFVNDAETFFIGLKEREQEATTGFKDGIAIPHSKNKSVVKPGMFLVKFDHAIAWNALDGKDVNVVFALTIPEEGAADHLKLLSLIARKLIDDSFREGILNENDPDKLTEIIDQISF